MREVVRLAVLLWLVLGSFTILAQEPAIRIALETDHLIFGQPVWATYTVTNNTGVPLYLSVEPKGVGHPDPFLLRWSAMSYGPAGKVVPIHKDFVRYIGENSSRPKVKLSPGESMSVSQPVPVTDVTMPELLPGPYKLIFSLSYSLTDTPKVWEKEATATTSFWVDAPEGADAAYLKALQEAIRAQKEKAPAGQSQESPLLWNDVLSPPIKGCENTLLVSYPTSIYAGYALYHRPAADFGCGSFADCLNYSEEAFRKECDHGAGPTAPGTLARMEWERANMNSYAHAAELFLRVHPNFSYAQPIRTKYAFCLAFTGRHAEAMQQVEILSKGTGKEAEEAKAYLEKKAAQAKGK